jgi:hypothetical protein
MERENRANERGNIDKIIRNMGQVSWKVVDHMPAPGLRGCALFNTRIIPSQSGDARLAVLCPNNLHMKLVRSIRGCAVKPKMAVDVVQDWSCERCERA